MKIKSTLGQLLVMAIMMVTCTQARSFSNTDASSDDSVSAVIPSPNQDEFGDIGGADDVLRRGVSSPSASSSSSSLSSSLLSGISQLENQEAASNEASVPVYVSPFVRAERSPMFHSLESSHAPPNYAPRPLLISAPAKDLKASASYGHHHHGYGGGHHGGYDHSGWLDMGAWTGGKGSFGWYADYPVGKGHGYGRK